MLASAAALSRVAAVMAAGGSPFDALPDELVARIIGHASEWSYVETGSIEEYSGSRRCTDQILGKLVRLSHISRRFRSLAQQPSLWERIHIQPVSNEAIEALLNQPKKRREAMRSLFLANGDLSDDSFVKLCETFGEQLTHLSVASDHYGSISPTVMFAIQHFSRLEQLYICGESESWLEENIGMIAGPIVQGGLQALASLPLQALELNDFAMNLETLQALAPLAPTLKRLHCSCGFIIDGALLPVFSSIAAFQQLEQLTLGFYNREGSLLWPSASEADLQPLSSLSCLRAYAVYVIHTHTGFLSGMRQLEDICLNMVGPADISALLPHAGSLRRAIITHDDLDEAASTSFTAAASKLVALEELNLTLPSAAFSAFAQESMKQWTKLKSLTLECMGHKEIPGAFLKRLASDVPNLAVLNVKSPLPLSSAGGLVAVSALKRLRRLVIEGEATSAANADTRRALRGALLRVKISFK
eukprot:tig00021070_g17871.t1